MRILEFMRLYLLASLFCLFSMNVLSETCPTAFDVKHKDLKDWKIYDSDNGILLSKAREKTFKQNADVFVLAEWRRHGKDGAIHCYYRNKTGSVLEAYLAKDHFVPRNLAQVWYQVTGAMHCAAGMNRCQFNSISNKTKRLAKR